VNLRLKTLSAMLVSVVAVRVAFPPTTRPAAVVDVVPATARTRVASASPVPDVPALAAAAGREEDLPGNAFAVRGAVAPASAPASSPAPPAVTRPAPARVAPPAVTAVTEPALPMHVIGTYDDGAGPAVFVATPAGTLLARVGTVLLAEYRVTGIGRQSVSLMQASTQRQLQLAIPLGAGS
jgi:hypothetical protein